MADVIHALNKISTPPREGQSFDGWLAANDALAFLKDNAHQEEFVVYAATQFAFIHAILVPFALLLSPDIKDLMGWNCNPHSCWGAEITFSPRQSAGISPPLEHTGSRTLDQGEQLVFARRFEGRPSTQTYYEVLQKFIQISELHFVAERNAYCRLDKHGDIEDAIRIVEIAGKGDDIAGTAITFDYDLLHQYLALTDSAIVRTFDFTRYRSGFSGWDRHDVRDIEERDLFYRSHIEPGNGSYTRGCQIIHCSTSKAAVIARFDHASKQNQYASFIAQDWKNGVVKEISCAPGHTANYFQKSDLPFELSPAFFRPEVLLKYKADSDKYRLDERSIYCRGTWHLETYDINEMGQVHTYLVYLRNLPYEEQLYWKSYNERPKAPISRRALKTDFEGTWDAEYNPLESLKHALREWYLQQVPWWTLRSEKVLEQVHYPVTPSPDEWANEMLQLDQLIVEGFETKWLRNKASAIGRTLDPKFGSLALLEECLLGCGYTEEHARSIVAPLKQTRYLRSRMKSHASGRNAEAIKQEILKEFKSYKDHFRALCGKCHESIKEVGQGLEQCKEVSGWPGKSVSLL